MIARRLLTSAGPAVLCAVLLASCGGGGGGSLTPPPVGSSPTPGVLTATVPIVAAQGGTVSLSDGSGVNIPAGFLAADGNVTLSLNSQGSAAAVPGWVAASGDLTLSFSSPLAAVQRRANGTTRALSIGNVTLTQAFAAANRAAILLSSALQITPRTSDGSTPVLSPDMTVDPNKNVVTASLSPSVFTNSTAMTSTIQFAPQYAAHSAAAQYFDTTANVWSDTAVPLARNKRTLVLVHGIFSSAKSTFPCASSIRALGNYDQVIGFTYDWSTPLGTMRKQFADFVNNLPPQDWIDIEAHSYGTDVVLESLKDIHAPVKNVILLAGPLPLNGMPLATAPGFLRSFILTAVKYHLWNPDNTDPGSIDRAGRSGMLSSLGTGSNEMKTVVDLVKSIPQPPKFIEAAGTVPFFFEPGFVAAYFNLVPPSAEYDGIIERKSALSSDFIGAGPLPISMGFPYNHQDVVCSSKNGEVQNFVASSLLMPVVAGVPSLSFTQTGAANAQQFGVSQKNRTGAFSLAPGTNGAVATARISDATVTVTPVGQGSTTVTVVGDSGVSVTVSISVSQALGQVTASVSSLSFTQTGAANAQQFTVSQANYAGAFTLSPGINSAIATAQISGSIVTVTPVASGSTSVTVAGGAGQSVTVPISVSQSTSTTLASGLYSPGPLVLQSGYLYIADFGSLDRIPTGGGALQQLVTNQTTFDSGSTRGIDRFAFSGANIYYGFGGYVSYFIDELPNSTGPPAQIATPSGGVFTGIIGANLYYSNGFCCIMQQPLSGGSATTALSGVWVRSVAVDNSAIYFVDYRSKNVDRFDVATGTLTPLITGNSLEGSITIDQQNVYFALGTTISKVSKQGGSVAVLYTGQSLQLLAADGARVFFAENGNLRLVPAGGGAAQTLVSGASPAAAVSDGTYLYWANSSGPGAANVYRLQL